MSEVSHGSTQTVSTSELSRHRHFFTLFYVLHNPLTNLHMHVIYRYLQVIYTEVNYIPIISRGPLLNMYIFLICSQSHASSAPAWHGPYTGAVIKYVLQRHLGHRRGVGPPK